MANRFGKKNKPDTPVLRLPELLFIYHFPCEWLAATPVIRYHLYELLAGWAYYMIESRACNPTLIHVGLYAEYIQALE